MSCSTHIPEYDAAVNETYCQVCLERLPNAPPRELNPRLPKITRTGLVFLILGLMLLYIWYPSQRDPRLVSETPCHDINEQLDQVRHLAPDVGAWSCSPGGRFRWQAEQ